jgi:hypothetical protein
VIYGGNLALNLLLLSHSVPTQPPDSSVVGIYFFNVDQGSILVEVILMAIDSADFIYTIGMMMLFA